MFALAYRLVQDETEALDMVQDVLTKLWEMRYNLPLEGADKAYCLTMVRNRCLDKLRQQQIIHFQSLEADEHVAFFEADTGDPYTILETQDYLDCLLRELPDKARQIVELRLRDGFSFREIEQLSGITEGNARVILLRTLKRLRNEQPTDQSTPNRGSTHR